jgi:hypothetical protein
VQKLIQHVWGAHEIDNYRLAWRSVDRRDDAKSFQFNQNWQAIAFCWIPFLSSLLPELWPYWSLLLYVLP